MKGSRCIVGIPRRIDGYPAWRRIRRTVEPRCHSPRHEYLRLSRHFGRPVDRPGRLGTDLPDIKFLKEADEASEAGGVQHPQVFQHSLRFAPKDMEARGVSMYHSSTVTTQWTLISLVWACNRRKGSPA